MTSYNQQDIERLTAVVKERSPGDRASLDLVIDTLRTRFDRRVRIAVLADLSSLLHESDGPMLVHYLLSPDDIVQDMLMSALLSPFWSLDLVPSLLAGLPRVEAPGRRLIIEALLNAMAYDREDASRAVATLLGHVNDNDASTRALVIEALGWFNALSAEAAEEAILPALADMEASVRKAAAWALGRLGWLGRLRDQQAVDPLNMLLTDPASAVRAQAAYALRWVGDQRSIAPLQQALHDPHPVVRRRVADALLRIDQHGPRHDIGPTLVIWPTASTDERLNAGALPRTLREAIDHASIAMRDHPQHRLPPDVRSAVLAAFGSYRDPLANRARGLLGILTARHVLPIFEQATRAAGMLRDDELRRLIALGEDVLMGLAMRGEVDDALSAVTGGPGPDPDKIGWPAVLARNATLSALAWIGGDNALDQWQRNVRDQETDNDDTDTAGCAALAEAWTGGGQFEHRTDPMRLQQFWDQWLTEIVPTAWLARESQGVYPESP